MTGVNPILPPVTADNVQFDPAVIGQKINTIEAEVAAIEPTVINNTIVGSSVSGVRGTLYPNLWYKPYRHTLAVDANNASWGTTSFARPVYVPLIIGADSNLANLRMVYMTSTVATAVLNIAIYSGETGLPNTLLGTYTYAIPIDGSTGLGNHITVPIGLDLPAGIYWIGVACTTRNLGGTNTYNVANDYHPDPLPVVPASGTLMTGTPNLLGSFWASGGRLPGDASSFTSWPTTASVSLLTANWYTSQPLMLVQGG